jgi:putative sterol carrier protein
MYFAWARLIEHWRVNKWHPQRPSPASICPTAPPYNSPYTHAPPDAFPASAAFDEISRAISGSDADRKDAVKKGGAIFAFTLKNTSSDTESWYIDLKETGTVGKGLAPEGKKPAVTLQLSDADFAKLVAGKANAQKLFMSGKLKVKGDVMKATKLDPILKKAQTGAKL